MMRKRCFGITLALAGAALLSACGGDDRTAGGGINNPNTPSAGINGSVIADGVPAPDVEVVLYRITYDDSTGLDWAPDDTVLTDNSGGYCFEGADNAFYSLVCEKGGDAAFGGYFEYAGSTASLDIGPVALAGKVDIAVVAEPRDSVDYWMIVAKLVGTPYRAGPSTDDTLVFQNIARGYYQMHIAFYRGTGVVPVADGMISAPAGYDLSAGRPACVLPSECGAADTVASDSGRVNVDNADFSIEIYME